MDEKNKISEPETAAPKPAAEKPSDNGAKADEIVAKRRSRAPGVVIGGDGDSGLKPVAKKAAPAPAASPSPAPAAKAPAEPAKEAAPKRARRAPKVKPEPSGDTQLSLEPAPKAPPAEATAQPKEAPAAKDEAGDSTAPARKSSRRGQRKKAAPSGDAPDQPQAKQQPQQQQPQQQQPQNQGTGDGGKKRSRRRRGGKTTTDRVAVVPTAAPNADELAKVPVDTAELTDKAWDLFMHEVCSNGMEIVDDKDAGVLTRRAFEITRVFLQERGLFLDPPAPKPKAAPAPAPAAPAAEASKDERPDFGE